MIIENQLIITRIHPIIEAINSDKTISKIFLRKGFEKKLSKLIVHAKNNNINYQFVPLQKLNYLTKDKHQNAIAIISPIEFVNLHEQMIKLFETVEKPIILIANGIMDVRNFGSIIRTSECMGVNLIIIPSNRSNTLASSVSTSSGAIFKVPISTQRNLKDSIKILKQYGVKIIAASEKAKKISYKADLNCPVAIMIGKEDSGIPKQHLNLCDEQIKIPLKGSIRSLNVSVAYGMIVYEALKQQQFNNIIKKI